MATVDCRSFVELRELQRQESILSPLTLFLREVLPVTCFEVYQFLRLFIVNMFHLFQNQLLGLSAGNAENTPNNNAMLNHFQTNLGIGPRSLVSQMQSNQCAMQSINAPIGQVALLQAQHAAAQNNPTTLQYNPPPLLELTATQRGILASQQVETTSSLFQHVHSNSAPMGQVQFNLSLSS